MSAGGRRPRLNATMPPILSEIVSECPLCGDRELFTGRTKLREGHRYAELRCCGCGSQGLTWRRTFEPAIDAYLATRAALAEPESYDRAWRTLRGGSDEIRRFIEALDQDGAGGELPLFPVEHLALPDEKPVVATWARLVLEYPGFRPEPSAAERLGEALILAARYANAEAAEAAARHVFALDEPGLAHLLHELPRRLGESPSVTTLRPFFDAVLAGPPYAHQALRRFSQTPDSAAACELAGLVRRCLDESGQTPDA